MITTKRLNISSDAKFENTIGYSRAVRIGNIVEIAGTTAMEDDTVVAKGDVYAQTKFILQKIEKALAEAGASLADVVRTRMYVMDISKFEEVGRAHNEFFKQIKPAATMIQVKSLINVDLLIEIEATAIINE